MNTQAKQQVHEGAMPILTERYQLMQSTKYRAAPAKALLQLDYMYIVCEVYFISYLK